MLDKLKVGVQYNRDEITEFSFENGFKNWTEVNTFSPQDQLGVSPKEDNIKIALTPRTKFFIKVELKNGDIMLFEEVKMPTKKEIYQRVA